jgi:hypothetical protein
MPYHASWCIPNQVVYIKQWGVVQLEDSVGTDRAIAEFALSSNNPSVHGIIDKLDVEAFAYDVKQLRAAFANLSKPTTGWVVAVHHSKFSAFLSQIMAQSQEMKTYTFHTLEDAVKFLGDVDDHLAGKEWSFDKSTESS